MSSKLSRLLFSLETAVSSKLTFGRSMASSRHSGFSKAAPAAAFPNHHRWAGDRLGPAGYALAMIYPGEMAGVAKMTPLQTSEKIGGFPKTC